MTVIAILLLPAARRLGEQHCYCYCHCNNDYDATTTTTTTTATAAATATTTAATTTTAAATTATTADVVQRDTVALQRPRRSPPSTPPRKASPSMRTPPRRSPPSTPPIEQESKNIPKSKLSKSPKSPHREVVSMYEEKLRQLNAAHERRMSTSNGVEELERLVRQHKEERESIRNNV